MLVPYTSEDYTIEGCREQADQLRQTGNYKRVEIHRKANEGNKLFARVYVERIEGS